LSEKPLNVDQVPQKALGVFGVLSIRREMLDQLPLLGDATVPIADVSIGHIELR
jgi:hypothetical protein